ncbi:ATPase, AAA-type, core domain and P-loop containing nucleoside triphosphate hydrolase domain-containing protein [Strongyloides ratti]|uniref:ATPase, AAA-type, core domain and P-loop containing nucleoside triphosphate hydrolase domain-containing protein n=1 Tax=Strongyloides ratti TaxID=34506 RepID=A0A090L7F3_STRRB|nr:ATPase, AAA-type, core domain and P-loop containing nucleoside triphosphate hydrolase domain-containing protein [Strongyloides ratti]CEF63454.1 ATPase, AAA-type, core domain and P-loop containing nucleoside triphosphate hydrolase domain-containing protein [Strongyloides ratti]
MTKFFPIFNCKNVPKKNINQVQSEELNTTKYDIENGRKSIKRKAPGCEINNDCKVVENITILEGTFDEITFDDSNDVICYNKIHKPESRKKKISEEIIIINEIPQKECKNILKKEKSAVYNKNKMYMKEIDYAPYSKLYHVPQDTNYHSVPSTYKFFFSDKTKITKENITLSDISNNTPNNGTNSFYIGYCPTLEETSKIYYSSMNEFMQSWYRYGAEARDLKYLDYNLLSSALKPDVISDFLTNSNNVEKLRTWMKTWKDKITNPFLFNKKKTECMEDDSDGSMDSINYMEIPFNPLIITGPSGIGKRSSIKFVAKELGFNLISLGCDEKRNSSLLTTKLSGAISNFGIKSSKEVMQNFFQSASTQKKEDKKKLGLTCVVIEDVDVIFDDDDGFWFTIKNFCTDSKIPIILTCNHKENPVKEFSKFPTFNYRKNVLQFEHIGINILTNFLQSLIFGSYKYYLNRIYLKQIIKEMKTDIRAILNHLHFVLSTGLQPIFNKNSYYISDNICFFKKSYLMNEILDLTSTNDIKYLPDFSEEYNKEIYQSYCEYTVNTDKTNGEELLNSIEYLDIINNLKDIRFSDNSSKTELATDILHALKIIDEVFESKTVRRGAKTRRHPFTRLGEMIKYPIIANIIRLKIKYISI